MWALLLVLKVVVCLIMILLAAGGIYMSAGRSRRYEKYKKWIIKLVPYGAGLAFILFTAQEILQAIKSNETEGTLADIRRIVSGGMKIEGANLETGKVKKQNDPTMDRVFPFLRFANALENYDGATTQAGNENRTLLPSSPPVRLHFDRYSKEHPAGFDFGVANLNEMLPIENVMFVVRFMAEGLTVTPEGNWKTDMSNQQYSFQFSTINAQSGLNGDGWLRVQFPRRGTYTIRLAINAKGLGVKTVDLPVIVE